MIPIRKRQHRHERWFRWCWRVSIVTLILFLVGEMFSLERQTTSTLLNVPTTSTTTTSLRTKHQQQHQARCAICLYGLPRAFRALVLPSLIENVLRPNAAHGCDYFVYYHATAAESAGRSGTGGVVRAAQVLDLEAAVRRYSPLSRIVRMANFTDDDFARQRRHVLDKVHTAKSANGEYLYVPVQEYGDDAMATTDNILKMWHGQEGVWHLMEQYSQEQQPSFQNRHDGGGGHYYAQVAMLRTDVVFLTPIALPMHTAKSKHDNKIAVVPQFAQFPVNDRMIYGPHDAVEIWAAQRFTLMDQHVQTVADKEPGIGIHDEKFLYYTIFPAMRRAGFGIHTDPDICFLRARADESVWATDCGVVVRNRQAMQSLVGHPCRGTWLDPQRKKKTVVLQCHADQSALPDDWSTNRPTGTYFWRYHVTQWKRSMGWVD